MFAAKACVVLSLVATIPPSDGGLLSYGACQAGCCGLAVACYSAAGAVFAQAVTGTVVATPATPAAILACNAAFGKCLAACAGTAVIAPTP